MTDARPPSPPQGNDLPPRAGVIVEEGPERARWRRRAKVYPRVPPVVGTRNEDETLAYAGCAVVGAWVLFTFVCIIVAFFAFVVGGAL